MTDERETRRRAQRRGREVTEEMGKSGDGERGKKKSDRQRKKKTVKRRRPGVKRSTLIVKNTFFENLHLLCVSHTHLPNLFLTAW